MLFREIQTYREVDGEEEEGEGEGGKIGAREGRSQKVGVR